MIKSYCLRLKNYVIISKIPELGLSIKINLE